MLIESDQGKFLFKRRPRGQSRPQRVAFAHLLQLFLAKHGFPLPHLVRTREHNDSILMIEGAVYEMFHFVEGADYDRSPRTTFSAGETLGRFHTLTRHFAAPAAPAGVQYHGGRAVTRAIAAAAEALPPEAKPSARELSALVEELQEQYRFCAAMANATGIRKLAARVIHGDWHPGNMIFQRAGVVAVMDYDSAGRGQTFLDVANGALQFSIQAGHEDVSRWPSQTDVARLSEFLRGYRGACPLDETLQKALPYLMCEAMIAEAVGPIAATGTFGRLAGFPFLQMIARKARWMLEHVEEMAEAIA